MGAGQEQIITVNNMVMVRRKKLVGSAMANKIHSTITKSILPNLFKCLTKRLKSDDQHKINKRQDEDEQILRVPMALAILQLLINLPAKTLDTHLPGLLFKVCDMLKSRAISVRNTTRECLMKMIHCLPSKKYYFYVFKELANALTRGYQVHVLCFTIQMVLKNVQDKLSIGDLDASLGTLMHSVNLELFTTNVSEEKEVKQILAKVMEAKTNSSFNTLEIVAKFVSQTHLLEFLRPFKEQLDACNSRKLLKKIEEALRRVLGGLLANTGLNTESLMFLVYGLINDTFTQLTGRSGNSGKRGKRGGKEKENGEEQSVSLLENSCLLIPSEPKRGGPKPKVQARTNQHVLVEFSLQLLHQLIKQGRLNNSNG
jgi:U3 small nucleolar RNA-associated protein 20